jgi:RimJ/RimL family protein N-acetyltransferase
MVGRYCRLEPLQPAIHATALYEAYAGNDAGWTYLAYGPFRSFESYRDWMDSVHAVDDPLFFAILAQGRPVGVASYLRIMPSAGSIEVGHLNFSPALQRSAAATEAMYLMMEAAFRLGYRRYEWKCDDLNAASRAAARRLGFSYEGPIGMRSNVSRPSWSSGSALSSRSASSTESTLIRKITPSSLSRSQNCSILPSR